MLDGVEESPTPTLPRREGGGSATLVALPSRLQEVGILLTIAEDDGEGVGENLGEGAFIEQAAPRIGFLAFLIGIEIDRVAVAEV